MARGKRTRIEVGLRGYPGRSGSQKKKRSNVSLARGSKT
jgi:hypothetical protein